MYREDDDGIRNQKGVKDEANNTLFQRKKEGRRRAKQHNNNNNKHTQKGSAGIEPMDPRRITSNKMKNKEEVCNHTEYVYIFQWAETRSDSPLLCVRWSRLEDFADASLPTVGLILVDEEGRGIRLWTKPDFTLLLLLILLLLLFKAALLLMMTSEGRWVVRPALVLDAATVDDGLLLTVGRALLGLAAAVGFVIGEMAVTACGILDRIGVPRFTGRRDGVVALLLLSIVLSLLPKVLKRARDSRLILLPFTQEWQQ